jgi:protein TonB
MRRAIFLAFLLASSGIAVAQNTKVEVKVTPDGAKVAEPGTQIFTVIEQKPEFPGGDEALYQFLAANLKYPCTDCECSGKVYITFVIEKDGSVSNAKVLRDPCPDHGFGEEALRVVNLMPKWKPGRQRGNPERVQYNLPINFSLK